MNCFFSNFILLGFILAIFGDIFLSLPGKISFLLGLFTFLGTHISYMIASISNVLDKKYKKKEYSIIPFLASAIFEGFALYMCNFIRNKVPESLFIPMAVYTHVLYIMCVTYFFRYEKTTFLSFVLMVIGVLCFAGSDSFLAVELVLKINNFWVGFMINILYYVA